WPVSVTSWPRVRPSVESIATVRTEFSPRCCATSSTSLLPWFLVSSAFKISGRCPSNCTSTTAPMIWRTRPTLLLAVSLFLRPYPSLRCPPGPCLHRRRPACPGMTQFLQRLGAGDDLDQLLGDVGLALAVVADRQLVDHVAGVAGGAVHRAHARALLG